MPDISNQHGLRLVVVEIEPAVIARINRSKAEMVGIINLKPLDGQFRRHDASSGLDRLRAENHARLRQFLLCLDQEHLGGALLGGAIEHAMKR